MCLFIIQFIYKKLLKKPGNVLILLQSIEYSPPVIGIAPILAFNLATSPEGPAKSEVPVSKFKKNKFY